jgi:hypothetical protein
MKSFKTTVLAITLLAAAGAASAQIAGQYESDGAFGPIASATTKQSKVELQMVSAAERAMNKADSKSVAAKPAMTKSADANRDATSFSSQVDSAR